jgi:ParB/RepB/Spo0J family partition protein
MDDSSMVFEDDVDVVRKDDMYFAPCAFNREGVTEQVCETTSAVVSRNRTCCQVNCASQARACRVCVLQPGKPARVSDRQSGLCEFHKVHGEAAVRPPAPVLPPFGSRAKTPIQLPAPVPPKEENPTVVQVKEVVIPTSQVSGQEILLRVRRAMSEAVLITLDTKVIRRMPGQPRKYFAEDRLAVLAESIRTCGQIMPGIIRQIPMDEGGHTHELLDGERRWRGCTAAGAKYRALVIEIDDEAAPYVVSVIANFNREGHTLLEIADAVKVMMEGLNMNQAEIGKSMGMHPVVVSNFYGLRRLEPEVRDMFDPNLVSRDKLLPKGAAFALSKRSPEDQIAKARALRDGTITLTDLLHERGPHGANEEGHSGYSWKTHEPGALWRASLRRAESIEAKTGNLLKVMMNLSVPENPAIGSSVYQTKRTLLRVKKRVEEALAKLESVLGPE